MVLVIMRGRVSPPCGQVSRADSILASIINMHTTVLINERNHAAQAAQESEQRYKRLLASVTDYVYSVTIEQGRPVATSHGPGCEAVTGYTSRELDADPFLWYRMVFGEDRPVVTDQAEQILRGETPPPLEHRIIHKNGTIRWIRNTPVPHKDALSRLVAYDGLVSDITERKRAEHLLAVEYTVTRELAETSSLDEAWPRILESICKALCSFLWDMAAFWSVDATANLLRCGHTWHSASGQAKDFAAASRQLTLAPGISLPGQVWASGEPAWVPDIVEAETNTPRAPSARKAGLHGACAFPIRSGKTVVGVIELFNRERRPPDLDMMQVLMALGTQIGQFIERNAAREQHRLDEAQLRAILDNSPATIHLKDAQSRYILANRRFQQRFHLSSEEIIGKSPNDLFPKERAEAVRHKDQQALAARAPVEFEETLLEDGKLHTYLSVKFPLLDSAGVPYALCGISTDITERKQAEVELQRSAEEIRDLYNNAPCGYHSLDKDGVFLQINDTELKWLGYSRDEVVGKMRFSDFLTPEGLEVFHRNFPQFRVQGLVSNLEFEMVRKDGTTLAVLLSATAVKDASGNYEMSRTTIFDITERRRAELALRQSEQRLALVIQGSSDGVWDWNLTTNEVYFSPRWKGMLGYAEHELRNHFSAWEGLLHPADREHAQARLQAYLAGQTPTYELEHRLRHKDGSYRWILARAVALRDAQGKPVRMAGSHVDLTERRQAEEQIQRAYAELSQNEAALQAALQKLQTANVELQTTQLQLIQAAKLESLGTLAAGVAHEVKNPLQTILMGLDYLANNLPRSSGTPTLVLSDMRDAVTRANVIVRELLQLSAPKDFEPKEEDFNGAVERSLWLINNGVVASQISVVRKLAADLPRVLLDRNKMEQVFINLFSNALHAMSKGGVLTVTTRKRRFGEDLKVGGSAFPQFKPGDQVVIADVRDTGKGIPEDLLPKVFDPFFTTKPPGVGTGLGLSVVKTIIDLHGGAIDIRNGPLGGVVVTLMLRA